MSRPSSVAIALALVLGTCAGCGQKGPLTLDGRPAAAPAGPAAAAASTPSR